LDAGISPKIWVDELISDMELGKKDYLGMLSTKPKQFLNKYL
jgi:hypothetical protein